MVYTRLHVLLIDNNKIEIGSDSNFGGKVTTSFLKISRLRKNITKYNWYVFTSNKYYAMVYIKDRSGIGFFARQSVTHCQYNKHEVSWIQEESSRILNDEEENDGIWRV